MFFLFFCHLSLEVDRRSRKSEQILSSVRAEQPVSIAFQAGAEFERLVILVLLYMTGR